MAKLTVIWDDSADPKSDAQVKDAVDWHVDYVTSSRHTDWTVYVCQCSMVNQYRLSAFGKDIELEFQYKDQIIQYDNKTGGFIDWTPVGFDDLITNQLHQLCRNRFIQRKRW